MGRRKGLLLWNRHLLLIVFAILAVVYFPKSVAAKKEADYYEVIRLLRYTRPCGALPRVGVDVQLLPILSRLHFEKSREVVRLPLSMTSCPSPRASVTACGCPAVLYSVQVHSKFGSWIRLFRVIQIRIICRITVSTSIHTTSSCKAVYAPYQYLSLLLPPAAADSRSPQGLL